MSTVRRRSPERALAVTVAAGLLAALACQLPVRLPATTEPEQPQPTGQAETVPAPAATAAAEPAAQPGGAPACLAGLIPGSSTRAEVIEALGQPAFVHQDAGVEALYFVSPRPRQYHTVLLRDEVVERVSVVMGPDENRAWSALADQHGPPPVWAFSTYDQGSFLYAYPALGLDFVVSPEMDTVHIRGCFAPLPDDAYRQANAGALLAEDPFEQ